MIEGAACARYDAHEFESMLKRARTSAAKGLSAEETRKVIIRSYRKG